MTAVQRRMLGHLVRGAQVTYQSDLTQSRGVVDQVDRWREEVRLTGGQEVAATLQSYGKA